MKARFISSDMYDALEIINRIICRTNSLYMIPAHKSTSSIFGIISQFVITLIENLTGSLRTEQLRDTESSL